MNNLEEFTLEEARDIREKVDYIRINNTAYKGLSYRRMLEIIIIAAIDSNKAEALEAARLIKFNYECSKGKNMYQGYTYIIPARDNLIIDKAIKVLKVAFGSTDYIKVKFVKTYAEIEADNEDKKQIQKHKILSEEKEFVANQLFGDIKLLTDEEIKEESKELPIVIEDYEAYRKGDFYWKCERRYRHIKWVLNDVKQAELFGVSVEEYRDKYKKRNIQDDKWATAFLDYVKTIQENMNRGFMLMDYICDVEEFNPTFDDLE